MKTLLIFPPQWNPANPYLSVPLLVGRLKQAGYEAEALDLNIKFFCKILTASHLTACKNSALRQYEAIKKEIFGKYENPFAVFDRVDKAEQTKLLKLKKLNSFLSQNVCELKREDYSCQNTARYGQQNGEYLSLDEVISSVDDAVRVIKDKNDFYNPEKLFDAKMLIQEALKIASLPYAPNEMIWDNYFANPVCKMDWEAIDSQCKDREINMFYDFFDKEAQAIGERGYALIGISVPDLSQLIPALTLARLLKKYTGAHITVGGNYITQNKENFMRHPEIFREYADSFMTGDGEYAILQLADLVAGKGSIADVCGLLYQNGQGEILCGATAPKIKMNENCYADFSDYNLRDYFSPQTVLPIQLSKGCYWGKCAFCDYYYGQQCFDIKTVHHAVDELAYYQNTYGITHFIFIDEAIPPKYYKELSEEIIRRGLTLYFYSFARLETDFTPEVLGTMYKAGCRILMWGYECASPRLMKMMNKGIKPENRLTVMQNAHEAGIWNNALFIIGYPTETREEIEETLSVIKNNRAFINSCTPSNFALKKNAVLAKHIGENGVLGCEENGEFYTVYKDRIDGVTQEQRREIRRQFHLDYITENAHCLWPVVYSDFDSVLLYMAKYGLSYVSGYRSKRDICPMFR